VGRNKLSASPHIVALKQSLKEMFSLLTNRNSLSRIEAKGMYNIAKRVAAVTKSKSELLSVEDISSKFRVLSKIAIIRIVARIRKTVPK
jgi:hypothetical protein